MNCPSRSGASIVCRCPTLIVLEATELFHPSGMLDIVAVKSGLKIHRPCLFRRSYPSFATQGFNTATPTAHVWQPLFLQGLSSKVFLSLPKFSIPVRWRTSCERQRRSKRRNLRPWNRTRCRPQKPQSKVRLRQEVSLQNRVIWKPFMIQVKSMEARHQLRRKPQEVFLGTVLTGGLHIGSRPQVLKVLDFSPP